MKNTDKGERFIVTLDKQHKQVLKAISEKTGASIAFLIRRALDQVYLKGGNKK